MTMSVMINGSEHRLAEGATLEEVVASLGVPPKGLAVAVNREVVPASRWAVTVLKPGDRVEVLRATAGG